MSSVAASSTTFKRSRTGWDVAFGVLSVIAGAIVLAHVAVASVVSVWFVGWMLIAAAVVAVVWAIAAWNEPGHWWGLISGGVLGALGFAMVRFTAASLLVLTLLAGSLLLVGGIARLVAAFQPGAPRGLLLFNGAVTLLLALLILFQFPYSALWYLGVMLGVSLIVDGATTAMTGRYRVTPQAHSASAT